MQTKEIQFKLKPILVEQVILVIEKLICNFKNEQVSIGFQTPDTISLHFKENLPILVMDRIVKNLIDADIDLPLNLQLTVYQNNCLSQQFYI
ncbi:hypothetical protein [Pedobacter jejuensis]|uniref:Uncharacterized protein n=1 Tax=Pedobacter jejuensis TaxID=1268550 RepID=A0A3N0C1S8_9SPHI|nr:hypothetical protein [Pedobacter jejuensis]RNL55781.1 hypothetical protein D7004_03220 [Pedobacter jejuensis]